MASARTPDTTGLMLRAELAVAAEATGAQAVYVPSACGHAECIHTESAACAALHTTAGLRETAV